MGLAMRHLIRSEVTAIDPLDDIERQTVEDVLTWIDSGAELCRLQKPDRPPKHLVSYFACIDGQHILLVDHKNAQLWLPTGGHVEPDEHPRTTVLREAEEELGIRASFLTDAPMMVTCTTTVGLTAGHTDVSLWYVLRGDRQQSLVFDANEFNRVEWFPFANVPLMRSDPHMGRFLKKLALTVTSS
jgi:8-oxo-dGTP pyrophosphatase MutT (NUDIX family)